MSDDSDNETCTNCGEECSGGELVYLKEWLTVEPKCDECGNKGCSYCLTTCMTCANNGDVADVLCQDCNEFENVCTIHNWYVCDKHSDKKCGECRANKNYSRYGEF